ncbi:DUF3332 family protein [Leptospira langatensis]|uniref:DUF3332 family protein n=1 Tax=Leptospira langatensis TaxID=2484983 RepID=A0A5F1ZXX0_9LEPT|nr:DUF3332 family protein [Leptospira langatensis]TGJ99999.1 DUF3332 family protein [Leptospira langatensis]TGL42636.1 DUF3332 family protein [Leptospira langatensis]
MAKNVLKKIVLSVMLVGITFGSLANCFGKFALVRVFYNANDGINVGGGLLAKIVKTILFYIPFGFLMAIGGFIDFLLFNLIEFWSGSNPVGLNEYDQEGKFAKSFEKEGEKLTLIYSNFGARLDLTAVSKEGKSETLTAFRAQPGKFFVEKEGKLSEVAVTSQTVGSQVILKLTEQGKLKSSKVVEAKTLEDLELKAAGTL